MIWCQPRRQLDAIDLAAHALVFNPIVSVAKPKQIRIGTLTTFERVVTTLPIEYIVSAKSLEHIVATITGQDVVQFITDSRIMVF